MDLGGWGLSVVMNLRIFWVIKLYGVLKILSWMEFSVFGIISLDKVLCLYFSSSGKGGREVGKKGKEKKNKNWDLI